MFVFLLMNLEFYSVNAARFQLVLRMIWHERIVPILCAGMFAEFTSYTVNEPDQTEIKHHTWYQFNREWASFSGRRYAAVRGTICTHITHIYAEIQCWFHFCKTCWSGSIWPQRQNYAASNGITIGHIAVIIVAPQLDHISPPNCRRRARWEDAVKSHTFV